MAVCVHGRPRSAPFLVPAFVAAFADTRVGYAGDGLRRGRGRPSLAQRLAARAMALAVDTETPADTAADALLRLARGQRQPLERALLHMAPQAEQRPSPLATTAPTTLRARRSSGCLVTAYAGPRASTTARRGHGGRPRGRCGHRVGAHRDRHRDLVGARYAALGVLDPGRTYLAQFITVGLDDDERAPGWGTAEGPRPPRGAHHRPEAGPSPRPARAPRQLRVPVAPSADDELSRRSALRPGRGVRQPLPHRQGGRGRVLRHRRGAGPEPGRGGRFGDRQRPAARASAGAVTPRRSRAHRAGSARHRASGAVRDRAVDAGHRTPGPRSSGDRRPPAAPH